MTREVIIKTKNERLNEILKELSIINFVKESSIGGLDTSWHEIKVREINKEGIVVVRPINIDDLVKLYEMITKGE